MTKQRLRRVVLVVVLGALSLYVAVGVGLYATQCQLIFPGQFTKVDDSPPVRADIDTFRVTTSVGETDAWSLAPFAAAPGGRSAALIFAHGNGEVIDQWVGALDEFRRWGMRVLLVEYPGYGRSQGQPSEAAIREAMIGGYDLLARRTDVDRERIVGYGQSLGGGAICDLARDRHLAAIILQSTFTSLRPFAHQYFLPSFLVRDPFDNDEVVRQYEGPVLVLHGRHDELIPPEQAVALVELSPHGSLHLYDCGHGCWSRQLPLLSDIHTFLEANAILARDNDETLDRQSRTVDSVDRSSI